MFKILILLGLLLDIGTRSHNNFHHVFKNEALVSNIRAKRSPEGGRQPGVPIQPLYNGILLKVKHSWD